MFCRYCGKFIYDGSKFCQYCGGDQGPDARSSSDSSDFSKLEGIFSSAAERKRKQEADEAAMFEIRNGVLVKFHMPSEPVPEITIPAEVTVIGERAFERVYGLEKVYVAGNLRRIEKEAFRAVRINYFQMPSSVTYIGEYAFSMTNIEKADIPEGITHVESHAFSHCQHIETVILPRSITHIGNGAFNYCTALRNIYIPSGVVSIGENAFRECRSLEYLELPEGLRELGSCALYETGIKSLTVYDKLSEIPPYLCYNCKNLSIVRLGNSIKRIDAFAFADCPHLMGVETGRSLEAIGTSVFECFDSQYELSLELPATLNSIDAYFAQGRFKLSISFGGSEAKWKSMLGNNCPRPPAKVICYGR